MSEWTDCGLCGEEYPRSMGHTCTKQDVSTHGAAQVLWGKVKPYLRHSHGCSIFSIAPEPRCNCGMLKHETALDEALHPTGKQVQL